MPQGTSQDRQSQSLFACHRRQHGCHAETCCDKVAVEAGLFVDRRRTHCRRFDDFLGLAQPLHRLPSWTGGREFLVARQPANADRSCHLVTLCSKDLLQQHRPAPRQPCLLPGVQAVHLTSRTSASSATCPAFSNIICSVDDSWASPAPA